MGADKYQIVVKLINLAILCYSLCSCDPIHTIDISNTTESDIRIDVKLKRNYPVEILPNQPKDDSLSIHLGKGDTESLYLGLGTWSDHEIKYTAELVEKVTITSDSTNFTTTSGKLIERALKENLDGGWWKTKVHIKVE